MKKILIVLALASLACGMQAPAKMPTQTSAPATPQATQTVSKPANTPNPTITLSPRLCTVSGDWNIRTSAEYLQDGSNISGLLRDGEQIEIVSVSGDWLQIRRGWVHVGACE